MHSCFLTYSLSSSVPPSSNISTPGNYGRCICDFLCAGYVHVSLRGRPRHCILVHIALSESEHPRGKWDAGFPGEEPRAVGSRHTRENRPMCPVHTPTCPHTASLPTQLLSAQAASGGPWTLPRDQDGAKAARESHSPWLILAHEIKGRPSCVQMGPSFQRHTKQKAFVSFSLASLGCRGRACSSVHLRVTGHQGKEAER